MSILAELLSTIFERRFRESVAPPPGDRPIGMLAIDLVGSAGEASGRALASEILSRFETLSDGDKLGFFRCLATEMNIDPDAVRRTVDAYERHPARETYRAYMEAAEPRRQELIRRLNRVPQATGALVRMRADLLRLGRREAELEALDLDFRHLFASWFNRGFLVLRPINWTSPAHILEKIIAYEAVHAIDSWDELRRRLEPADRRCFAFFHPAIADEPLIFVEVALTRGSPNSVQALLAKDRRALPPESADTAAFYSISNCQQGLANVSFGSSLIKQVAADLSAELPALKTFVTLSPIPGLVEWLTHSGRAWSPDDADTLSAHAAYYLLEVKRDGGVPHDPVARFHLGNGALVHGLQPGADLSNKGLSQSGGMMVNYLYDLSRVAHNHEKFVNTGRVLASEQVRSLATRVNQARKHESLGNG